MPFRIRIDDVMVDSKQWSGKRNPEARFEQYTRWIEQVSNRVLYVPTIITSEMTKYPKTLELLKEKTNKKIMTPQLHGYEHVDYNRLTREEISYHLEKSIEWFQKELGYAPTVWCTPWGAQGEIISEVASGNGLIVEGVERCLDPGDWLHTAQREGLKSLENRTLMSHWWERGLKVLRIIEVIKHGSYEAAALDRGDIF